MLKHIVTVTHREQAWKRVPTKDGHGFILERDGWIVGELLISIDAELLTQMVGRRAFNNKSGQTKLQRGAVTVESSRVRREP